MMLFELPSQRQNIFEMMPGDKGPAAFFQYSRS